MILFVVKPGPVLQAYVDGVLVAEARLTRRASIRLIINLLTELAND